MLYMLWTILGIIVGEIESAYIDPLTDRPMPVVRVHRPLKFIEQPLKEPGVGGQLQVGITFLPMSFAIYASWVDVSWIAATPLAKAYNTRELISKYKETALEQEAQGTAGLTIARR